MSKGDRVYEYWMFKPMSSIGKLAGIACTLLAIALLVSPALAQAETCPNEEFRTGAGANLPDCRAYELVSPPFTEATTVSLHGSFTLGGFAGMSADGSHIAMISIGDFGDSQWSFGGQQL